MDNCASMVDDYKPKGGPSTVRFHVLVAEGSVRDGERVSLRGSIFGQGGAVPMHRAADDRNIWECELELPIGMGETHERFLFEFRYAVEAVGVAAGDAAEVEATEGGKFRRHTDMHADFYHGFASLVDPEAGRPTAGDRVRLVRGVAGKGSLKTSATVGEIVQDDRDHLPYKVVGPDKTFAWYKESDLQLVDPRPPPPELTRPDPAVAPWVAFRHHFRREWSLLCEGRLAPAAFLARYEGLVAGVPGRRRQDAEDLFDELIEEYGDVSSSSGSDAHGGRGRPPPMCVAALLGCVGCFGLSSAETVWVTTVGTGGYWAKAKVPAPRPWCLATALESDVAALLRLDVKQLFGKAGKKKVVAGLEEAVERCAAQGSFGWLHVAPLLSTNGAHPDVSSCRDPKAFATAVAAIVSKATVELQARDAREPTPEQESDTAAAKDDDSTENERNLGLEWLRAALYYWPNISSFASLLKHEAIAERLGEMEGSIIRKIRNYEFPTKLEVSGLEKVVTSTPALQSVGVRLAAALLNNKEIDPFTTDVLDFVPAVAIHSSDAIEDTQLLRSSRELEVVDAAKEWLKRNHGKKQAETVIVGTIKWTKSALELLQERTAAMVDVMEDVDGLLRTELLQPHTRSLVFEMTRCHMFKGQPSVVLEAMCAAVVSSGEFGLHSSKLETVLAEKAKGLVKEHITQVLDKPAMIEQCLTMIVKNTRNSSVLREQLLEALAIAMSTPTCNDLTQPPDLASILLRQPQWSTIIHCASQESLADTALQALIESVDKAIREAGAAILDEQIGLRKLHAVLDAKQQYLTLAKQLRLGSDINASLLDQRRHDLDRFSTFLTEISVYVNFFCSCGVPIDASALSKTVATITAQYDDLPFTSVHGAFKDVLIAEDAPWLFKLQSSELFLATWRTSGAQVCQDIQDALHRKATVFDQPDTIVKLLFEQVIRDEEEDAATAAAAAAEAEAETEAEAEPQADDHAMGEDDDHLQELLAEQRELETQLDADDLPDQVAEELEQELEDVRGAIAERRLRLAGRPIPRVVIQRRSRSIRTSDLRSGVRTIALCEFDRVAVFQSGEITGVTEDDGDTTIEILWDRGHSTSLRASTVNQTFTVLTMRDRLMACLKLVKDLGRSTLEVPAEQLTEAMTRIMSGALVDPALLQGIADAQPAEHELTEVVLTQEQVATDLMQKAKESWAGLHRGMVQLTLSTAELQRWFHPLKSPQQRESEVRMLASTGQGCVDEAASKDLWITSCLEKVEEFILCCSLKEWLPGIVDMRTLLADLFEVEIDRDESMGRLHTFAETMQQRWSDETLASLSSLIEPVKDMFTGLSGSSSTRMDLFAALSQEPALVCWLLEHADTAAVNNLLQVCRPRTEDPLLLKAIASLIHVRTILLDLFYNDPPYISLGHMLERVRRIDMARGTSIEHLQNVQQSFPGLLSLFEKTTMGAGISACYELDEIRKVGVFVIKASEVKREILMLRLPANDTGGGGGGESPVTVPRTTDRFEPLEYVQDLRSKLMMTEIPAEVEEEIPDLRELIERFSGFIQILAEMRDVMVHLVSGGHFAFQGGFSEEYRLDDTTLVEALKSLTQHIQKWESIQAHARESHFFLNYYTSREVLHLITVLQSGYRAGFGTVDVDMLHQSLSDGLPVYESTETIRTDEDSAELVRGPAGAASVAPEVDDGELATFCAVTNQSEDTGLLWVSRFESSESAINEFFARGGDLPPAVPFTQTSNSESAAQVPPRKPAFNESPAASIIYGFHELLYGISSSVSITESITALHRWAIDNHQKDSQKVGETEKGLDRPSANEEVDEHEATPTFEHVDSSEVLADLVNEDAADLLDALGSLLCRVGSAHSEFRQIDPPLETCANRSDMIGVIVRTDSNDQTVPIWVTCAPSPTYVIDVVLSIYVRRGRLPEPGEIVFCTVETSVEQVELLFNRFLMAKAQRRNDSIFCLADIHTLSYTRQCAVTNSLQAKLAQFGTQYASSLVIVSGRPRQVILNSLSHHALDCPPLPTTALQRACAQASALHGMAQAVRSDANGQGKSFWIMKYVAVRDSLTYHRIPIHEATSAGALIDTLSAMSKDHNTVHLDIGHIIPAYANTLLFELLLIGYIKDTKSTRVYHRRPSDIFFIEIPNSLQDKTAKALRFASFLPQEIVECSAATLAVSRPKFHAEESTRLIMEDDKELMFVCKMLRALKNDVFCLGSESYDLTYQPASSLTDEQSAKIMEFSSFTGLEPDASQAWLSRFGWEVMVAMNVMMDGGEQPAIAPPDRDITLDECFDLLMEFAQIADNELPTFTSFNSLVKFLYPSLKAVTEWQLINSQASTFNEHQFKDSFIKMLVATSKDFATRSVPQGNQRPDSTGTDEDDGSPMKRTRSGNLVLARTGSIERLDAAHALGEGALDGRPPPAGGALTRQNSRENANRFDSMLSWENSDHPVAIWKVQFGGAGIDGVDILSMNPNFVQQYLNDNLRHLLRGHGLVFDRDWKTLTNEEAIDLLCHAMGRSRDACPRLPAGYVITIDNLLKMLSIALRMRCGLPVIVMGETGCGKSSLITGLCKVLGYHLHTLNIHGGIEDRDIMNFVESVIESVSEAPAINDYGEVQTHVMFLDEINTCNSMGLAKEILCDGSMKGRRLPPSIKAVAACNPYRLKGASHEMDVGLHFQHEDTGSDVENVGTGIKDPLSQLVYRVHPLPESLIEHVFDFGSLSATTEKHYIRSMLKQALAEYIDEESQLEEISADDQLEQQAARMGIEFTEEMSQEDRQALLRQAYRDMLHAEARRRADAGEAADDLLNDAGGPQRGGLANKALSRFGEFVETFTELVCTAQEFVRAYYGGERSAASLRDVARLMKVYRWFGEHFATTAGSGSELAGDISWTMADFFSVSPKARQYIRSAVIMSLAYCYHSRLPREQRMLLRHALTDAWIGMQVPATTSAFGWYIAGKDYCTWLSLTAEDIQGTIEEVQRSFVDRMVFPSGIALNEALCENTFMVLVSILNQIPIFIVGKPGTSKSLAMELVQTNLQGKASSTDFLRSLPAVQTFSYQCSPLSTSAGIQQAFDAAKRYKMEAPNTVVCVLLDEVGLAEQSPHLPLKVLHKTLDEAGTNESVVGISNWSLDPAKMNRAVHLYRPSPTIEDLALTAEGMVQKAAIKGYLQAVAKAFSEVYQRQRLTDFFGMREFYSTVRAINAAFGDSSTLDAQALMTAVLRNYGGRTDELESIISSFFVSAGLSQAGTHRPSVLELAQQNIEARDARHLMLLTKNNAALGLLFDKKILHHEDATVIFGSDFPDDNTDLQIMGNIQRVKHCMARGTTLVLVHCDAMYESMYDLLNQHYTRVGCQLFVRLAFGTHSRLCPIANDFRVIVIVEKIDAYTRLAPPLLNRFEKQVMERREVMGTMHLQLAQLLKNFIKSFSAEHAATGRATQEQCKAAICGYHTDLLPSLSLCIVTEAEQGSTWYGTHEAGAPLDMDKLYLEALWRLLLIATPDAASRVLQDEERRKLLTEEFQADVADTYFRQQSHSDLPGFVESLRKVRRDGRPQLMQVMTYAPLFMGAAPALASIGTWQKIDALVLHELSSERDLQTHVARYFDTAVAGSLLLIQCDPRAASLRRIEHARYICEKAMDDFRRHKGASFFKSTAVQDLEPEPEQDTEPEPEFQGESEPEPVDKSAVLDKYGKVPTGAPKESDRPTAKSIDVLVLCHLPRGNRLFSVDFGVEWAYGFVDSIMPASTRGLLGVEDMMQHSLASMVREIDLGLVLGDNFRVALTRLLFLYERSQQEVRQQVADILECLSDGTFVELVRDCMLTMIDHNKLELDIALTNQVGTFMEALHRQFTDCLSAMFAVVLAHMDRNGGLPLFLNAELRSLWSHLFSKSFKEMNIAFLRTISMQHLHFRLEVRTDGKDKQPFSSHFPFSGFLNSLLEGQRETVATVAAANDSDIEAIAIAQIKLLSIGHGVGEEMHSSLLRRYADDFARMHLSTRVLSGPQQTALLCRILELYRPDRPLSHLAAVHARYWDREQPIALYLQLLDAVPTAVAAVLELVQHDAEYFASQTGIVDSTAVAIDVAVLQCVLDHLDPTCATQCWETQEDCGGWLVQFDAAKPAVLTLLSLLTSVGGAAVTYCRLRMEQYTLVQQLTIDIFCTLDVPAATSKPWIVELLTNDIRTVTVLHALVRMLCLDIPSSVAVDDIEQERTLAWHRGSAMVMELWLGYIWSAGCYQSDEALAVDLLRLIANVELSTSLDVADKYSLLLPSEAGRVALLGQLLHVSDVKLKQTITAQLHERVDAAVSEAGIMDVPLAQTWLTIIESDLRASGTAVLDMATSIETKPIASGVALPVLLRTIAAVRILLTEYSRIISVVVDPSEGSEIPEGMVQQMEELKACIDPLLSTDHISCLRSMRMFLLKALERRRGVSFVRSAMQQHPLRDSPWFEAWIADQEAGLVRFVGANKLPQNNPLAAEPLFAEVSRGITGMISAQTFDTLEEVITKHSADPGLKSALASVLFHEIHLLECLPDALTGDTLKCVQDLRQWISSAPVLDSIGCTPTERQLLLFCAGGLSLGGSLSLNLSSTSEQIIVVRFLAHLVARVISSTCSSQFEFFRTLLLEPEVLKGSYVPTMPDDPLYMVQRALMEAGADRGAKRWFTCPNGHPFAIGDCGGAMQESRCPECGECIGGGDHNLLDSNKVLGDVTGGNATALFQATVLEDNSDWGYCLRDCSIDGKEQFLSARDLTAQALRSLRVIMHGVLTIGCLVGGDTWCTAVAETLVNPSYISDELRAEPSLFYRAHFQNDWAVLKHLLDINDDECGLLLHEAILLATGVPSGRQSTEAADVPDEEQLMEQGEVGVADVQVAEAVPPPLLAEDVAEQADGMLRQLQEEIDQLRRALEEDAHEQDVPEIEQEIQRLQEEIAAHGHRRADGGGADAPHGGGAVGVPAAVPMRQRLDLSTPMGRGKWEGAFVAAIGDLLASEGKARRLQAIEKRHSQEDGDEGQLFKTELLERYDVASVTTAVRAAAMPGLWLCQRAFTFDHFEASFQREPANGERYPVLDSLLARRAELAALRHLPRVFRWLELLMERLDKRIDRSHARQTTVSALLEGLVPQTRAEWQRVFSSFEDAWKLSWHRVEAFGCQPVPELYRGQSMGPGTVLAFCLPGPTDEGMCPDFLCRYLVDTHNDFLNRVDQALLLRNQDVQRHAARTREIESGFMTQAHALEFDVERDFEPYVAKHCVRFTDFGELAYDFAVAEKFALRHFINLPQINLRLRGFNYVDEQTEVRANLGAKVAQQPLPPALAARIKAQLGSSAAEHALQTMLTVINFLMATLSAATGEARALLGEKGLGVYLAEDLLMPVGERELLGTAIGQQVSLKHLDSLCELLRSMGGVDALDAVALLYRAPLEPQMSADLRAAAPELELGVLVPSLRSFLVARCVMESISAGSALKESLDWVADDESGDFLSEISWFANFPSTVPMGCALATLELLSSLQ